MHKFDFDFRQQRSREENSSKMIWASVKRLNFGLYAALVFRLLMPTVYTTFR